MTREEEIKEMVHTKIAKAVDKGLVTWYEFAAYLAEQLIEQNYCKQVKAEWIPAIVTDPKYGVPVIVGFTCSNCRTKQEVNTNYCSFCGAKMVGRK